MDLLLEQLQRRARELTVYRYTDWTAPAAVRVVDHDAPRLAQPEFDDRDAPLLGSDWREPTDAIRWLRFKLCRPTEWPVAHTALVADRFGTLPLEPAAGMHRQPMQRMQGMLFLDGRAYHGLDQYHRLVYLPAGPDYQLAAKVWTGLAALEWQPAPVFRLVRVDPAASALVEDLRVLSDALRALGANETVRPLLERLAQQTLSTIDWSEADGPAFRRSLERAHELFEQRLHQLRQLGTEFEPTLVAVGHAHIDCAWLWPIAQTRDKAGRTWTTALRLMERYPEYRFLASTPLQYEMVKQDYPETFAAIHQRITEGRWETAGGMWVEADCNLPDGESLARQMLHGTRYFEREFGVATSVVWLPDSFGFTWALPTLMAAAGIPYFVTHKLSWNQTNRIPHDTFRWRGPDGREVLAHFLCMTDDNGIRTTYNGDPTPVTARLTWQRFQGKRLHDELLVAFGHGDGGGGPTIEMLESCRRLADLPGFPRVRCSTAADFFDRLSDELSRRADVPVWDNELYLEYHRGTYTGQARQKLRNALSQRLYHAAELYASTARALLGIRYPREDLTAGWRLILTNQFHDILPGSALSRVYDDAEADFQELAVVGQHVLDTALSAICAALGLEYDAVVVFNPSPYAASDYVTLPAELASVSLSDRQGRPVPTQQCASGEVLAFCDGVPPNGYRAFLVSSAGQTEAFTESIEVSATHLESPSWSIDVDANGRLSRIWDKLRQRDALAPGEVGNRLVIFEDKPLDYDAWDIDVFHLEGSHDVDSLTSARVLESGPERGVLELTWCYGETGRTRVTQRLCVYRRSARIDFVTEVDWQERQALLKVAFPTPIRNRRATYEIQFGTIDRPTHRNTSWEQAAFEVPAQRWVDLSDTQYGVALLADCKHGYSAFEHTLWLSLLKGAVDPDPEADRGLHQFTYSLLPHAAGLAEVRRAAYALTRPMLWRRESAHVGPLPTEFSLFSTTSAAVVAETAKWAEDEDALILRLYESEGGATHSEVFLGAAAASVDEVDLLERNPRPIARPRSGAVELSFRTREVKTLRVALTS